MDIFEFVVAAVGLGIASYRATHLVVHDTITEPARDRLHTWLARNPTAVRTAAITLTSCTYCAGWWISGIMLAVYLTATATWTQTPPLVLAVQWFAVAGVQAAVNRWDDTREVS